MKNNVWKRKRDDSGSSSAQPIDENEQPNNPAGFIKRKCLSEHPNHLQPQLFGKKFSGKVVFENHLKFEDFKGYMVQESFAKLHWENLLDLKTNCIYKDVVVEWMSTLSRSGDSLSGVIRGKTYTITPELIRTHFMVDGSSQEFVRLNETDAFHSNLYCDALRVVFGLDASTLASMKKHESFVSTALTPLAKILFWIVFRNIIPRNGKPKFVKMKDVFILYALLTGTLHYSFALIVVDNLWETFEYGNWVCIPHAHVVSELLRQLGAVSVDDEKLLVNKNHHLIKRKSVKELEFTENEVETQIYDKITRLRVSFLKHKTREFDGFKEDPSPLTTTVEISDQPSSLRHQHQQDQVPSGFDVSGFMIGFEGIISKAIQEVRSDIDTWRQESNRQYAQCQEQLAESNRELALLRDEVAKARVENQATLWAVERNRYYYEKESEEIRSYFDTTQQLKSIPREAYIAPDATLPYKIIPTPIRYPPVKQISHFSPQSDSQCDDAAAVSNDDVPQQFRPVFDVIFGHHT